MLTRASLASQARHLAFPSRNVDEFVAHGTVEALRRLEQLGLVLLGPECFITGTVKSIVKFIESNGYTLEAASCIDHYDEETLGRNIPMEAKFGLRWWLIQRRFLMGPSMAILLSRGDGASVLASLKQFKGARKPWQAAPNTIRAELPAINGLLNLVHSPDDHAALLSNADPFFSIKAIMSGDRERARERIAIFTSAYGAESERPTSYFYVLALVLKRILFRISWCAPSLINPIHVGDGLDKCLTDLGRPTTFRDAARKFARNYRNFRNTCRQLLRMVARAHRTASPLLMELYCIAEELLSLQHISNSKYEFYWVNIKSRLAGCGVMVSDWEELVLISSFADFDDMICEFVTLPESAINP